jgi:hypothetical protein
MTAPTMKMIQSALGAPVMLNGGGMGISGVAADYLDLAFLRT